MQRIRSSNIRDCNHETARFVAAQPADVLGSGDHLLGR
jgi:hypothetical protein